MLGSATMAEPPLDVPDDESDIGGMLDPDHVCPAAKLACHPSEARGPAHAARSRADTPPAAMRRVFSPYNQPPPPAIHAPSAGPFLSAFAHAPVLLLHATSICA